VRRHHHYALRISHYALKTASVFEKKNPMSYNKK